MSPHAWDSSLYDDRHSFVWRAGAGLLDLLNPQPGERILDLGCGTGHLTAKIAEAGAVVVGLDSSPAMIAQARQNFPSLRFVLAEARDFRFEELFDAVFSNAVLHWIPDAESVVNCVAAALRPGGRFVLEMGARGNVESIRRMLEEVLTESGRTPKSPWFYPSAGEYATLLEKHGFEIRSAQTFERWTKLEHPDRGLREWLEMFAGPWFEGISAADRAALLCTIEDRLRATLYKDGSWWADYRRLRIEAVKSI
ncbi:MAG TPA: methyltransferase domain-containing protein [Bryobacteraceae bacterium]|nr:methyltransferase domain-containing protein [Bryobacteraceae bacterium]